MAELYLFSEAGTDTGFSPTIGDKVLNNVDYLSSNVTRSAVKIIENFEKSVVTFTFARTELYALGLVRNLPEEPISVTIFKNTLPFWQGRVVSVDATDKAIKVTCDGIYAIVARSGRQYRINHLCGHLIYSENCGVIQNSWKSTYTTTASDSILTISGLTEADDYFNGGIAEMFGQKRHIKIQTGTTVKLSRPFTGVLTGTINLYPGCALTEAACIGFSNLVNHIGFARVAQKDPFSNTGLL